MADTVRVGVIGALRPSTSPMSTAISRTCWPPKTSLWSEFAPALIPLIMTITSTFSRFEHNSQFIIAVALSHKERRLTLYHQIRRKT
jgi:hypothetical protein